MKIALLVHDFHRSGGHSRYVAELASRWAAEHDVHVFANTVQPEPGITFHHVPAIRANALALILSFRHNAARQLRGMRFDIVHDQGLCCERPSVLTAHIVNRAWSLTRARARPNAKAKERAFGAVIAALEQRQYARAARTEVIAVSHLALNGLRGHYAFKGPATVIHHGVDSARFHPGSRSPRLRESLGVPPGEPLFLFVGDLRKGADSAIRALEHGHLLCVGATPPEPYRQLAAQLHRAHRVHFHGPTSTIESYYAGADALVHPTPYDAFGLVVLEAMAAGLPVVVSQEAGVSELIENGVNGFVLRSPAELPTVMQAAARSNTGAAARATALEHSWDRVAKETMAVYTRIRSAPPALFAFATQGTGGNDEARLRALLPQANTTIFPFARKPLPLLRHLLRERYPLAIMEGTGLAGGVPLLLARALTGQRYLVSSGDAVGPFIAQKHPLLGPAAGAYERLLYRSAAGFIGWSPYLAGRALTFGVRRAITAPGWAPTPTQTPDGARVRQSLGIPPGTLVIGIAGSLAWNARVQYCYGLELLRAAALTRRQDIRFLIAGEGTGRVQLDRLPDPRVILTGFIPREQLPDTLAAMDIASLPQSCDGVGSFRYTTKLSEYLASGLPVITGQLPAAYDLDSGWLWRLPGNAPWHSVYIEALAALLDSLTPEVLAQRRAAVPNALPLFDREAQVRRTAALISDILDHPCE